MEEADEDGSQMHSFNMYRINCAIGRVVHGCEEIRKIQRQQRDQKKYAYRANGTPPLPAPEAVGALCAALLRRPIVVSFGCCCLWPNSHRFCPMAASCGHSAGCALVLWPAPRFAWTGLLLILLLVFMFVRVLVVCPLYFLGRCCVGFVDGVLLVVGL